MARLRHQSDMGGGGGGESIPWKIDPQPGHEIGNVEVGGEFGDDGRGGESPRERPVVPDPTHGGVIPHIEQPEVWMPGRGGEAPRERSNATPRRPSEPTPQAGSSFVAGVQPFSPMQASASIGSMATPKLRGLFGSAGGLQGGGLGQPLDPVSNQASDPIDTLIQMLMKQNG